MRRSSVWIVWAAAAAAVATGAFAGTFQAAAQLACKPTIVNKVVRYCGPASAKLSVFSGVTFKNGTCRHLKVNGAPLLSLGLGRRSQNAATNNGLTYFGLTISGPPARPTGGGVIAYYKGKRWGGKGVSFKGTASSGKFVVKGINGSRGTATGNFRC